jgi:mono/diheme cytochrome c family protein
MKRSAPLVGGIAAALLALLPTPAAATGRIDYNRDVRPILSNHCFKCHGPDASARKEDLRLDIPEPDGGFAFVAGKPEKSEALKRIESDDPDQQMPPPETNKRLTKDQAAILRQWVADGAEYRPHWSFVPPQAAALPVVKNTGWPRNPIDRFVLARLEHEGLTPTTQAEKPALLRRVTLDLTGLPPTLEELDAFIADASAQAFERVVDRLLASPHYGERLAVDWLDAARYADTNGYFRDAARQAWPWRDWVINAFNRNLPYDQFTIDQLAGDLLPQPTMERRIATGFNRNNMTNNETGLIDEEYRIEYVAERLETTGTVWMGMTIGCARCHDHKYDPISQREYYQLSAFFNNSPERGLVSPDSPPPVMDVATPAQRAELEKLTGAKRDAEAKFNDMAEALREPMAAWEKTATSDLSPPEEKLALHVGFEPEAAGVAERGNVTYESAGLLGHAAVFDGMQHLEASADVPLLADQPWSLGLWLKPAGSLSGVLGKIEPEGGRRGFEVIWQKGRFQINFVHRWGANAIEVITKDPARTGDWQQLVVSYDGSQKAAGIHVYIDGISVPLNIVRDRLNGPIDNAEPLRMGRRDNGLGFYGQLDELRLLRRTVGDAEVQAWYWSDRLRGSLALDATKRNPRQKQHLLDYYVSRHADPTVREAHRAVLAARTAESAFRELLPKTLVMEELPEARTAYILKRGKYDDRGEAVPPDVPSAFPPLPADAPRNRLGLARWLASPGHPLTARVAMNRLWKQCFGEGLVRTANDFGAQGDAPTHPELLDWLAVNFVEGGWKLKEMLNLIVTSATYRQSSVPTPALLERDPENRLLARGPRFRLPAEMIRDQALGTSALLVKRIGGPSVKPYQPPGLWETVTYDGEISYDQEKGEGLWRRSLYTYWKRQAPPPTMLTFDGPTREICAVNRPRTNTPLQALAVLNDVTFVEAGRALASIVLAQPGDDRARLRYAFRRATARWPDEPELQILGRLLDQQRAQFLAHPIGAKELVAQGDSPVGRGLDPVELAAWTVTAHALLNLDEVINRR